MGRSPPAAICRLLPGYVRRRLIHRKLRMQSWSEPLHHDREGTGRRHVVSLLTFESTTRKPSGMGVENTNRRSVISGRSPSAGEASGIRARCLVGLRLAPVSIFTPDANGRSNSFTGVDVTHTMPAALGIQRNRTIVRQPLGVVRIFHTGRVENILLNGTPDKKSRRAQSLDRTRQANRKSSDRIEGGIHMRRLLTGLGAVTLLALPASVALSAPATAGGFGSSIVCKKLSGSDTGSITVTGSKCKAKPPKGYGNLTGLASSLLGSGTLTWTNGDTLDTNVTNDGTVTAKSRRTTPGISRQSWLRVRVATVTTRHSWTHLVHQRCLHQQVALQARSLCRRVAALPCKC